MFRDGHGWRFGRIAGALAALYLGGMVLILVVNSALGYPTGTNLVLGPAWALLFLAWFPAEVVLLATWVNRRSHSSAALVPRVLTSASSSPSSSVTPRSGERTTDEVDRASSTPATQGIPATSAPIPQTNYGFAAVTVVLIWLGVPILVDRLRLLPGAEDPSGAQLLALLWFLLLFPVAIAVVVLTVMWAVQRSARPSAQRTGLLRDDRGLRLGVMAYLAAVGYVVVGWVFGIVDAGSLAGDVLFFVWVVTELAIGTFWFRRRWRNGPHHRATCHRCGGEGCWYCDGTGSLDGTALRSSSTERIGMTLNSIQNGGTPMNEQERGSVNTPLEPPPYVPPPQMVRVVEVPRQVNGLAIAAMVLGILAAFGFWFPIAGQLLAIVAVILGVLGLTRATKHAAGGKGMAITGIVLGAVSLVGGLILTVVTFMAINDVSNDMNQLGYLPEIQEQLDRGSSGGQMADGTDDSQFARDMFEDTWGDATPEVRAAICQGFDEDPRGTYEAFISGFSSPSEAPTYGLFTEFFGGKCAP